MCLRVLCVCRFVCLVVLDMGGGGQIWVWVGGLLFGSSVKCGGFFPL